MNELTGKMCLIALIAQGLAGVLAGQGLQRFEYEHGQMGTLFRIILYAESDSIGGRAAGAAFARIDTLNAVLSDYRGDSELSRLPALACDRPFPVSGDLWRLLCVAQQLAAHSGGAFDISIGPLSRLWRRAFRQQAFPEKERIDAAAALVAYRDLELLPGQQALFKKCGMRLDAGGIAKGYAVDEAMAVLRSHGIASALIDGGGDLLAADGPPGEPGWRILLKTAGPEGELQDSILYLSRGALATSGDTYRYLEWEGRRYSHIIDPRTGLGVSHGALVSVAGPSCTLADGLASAASVIGPQGGWPQMLEAYPGYALQFVYPGQNGRWRRLGILNQKTSKE